MQPEHIYDLAFTVTPDGGIELEQGFTEVNRISLHACHARLLCERVGHLLPPQPVDELAACLAQRLVETHAALATLPEGDSHGLAVIIARLSGFVEAIPKSIANPSHNEQGERPAFNLTNPT